MQKSVSVIIPTYNSMATIRRCLESALNQTFAPIEIIIVDDCSTDGTYEFLLNLKQQLDHKSKLIVIRNTSNQGPSFSRNQAIKISSGKWIAFLDSDDFWHPQKIEFQLEVAQANQCYFIGCESRVLTPSKIPLLSLSNIKIKKLTQGDFWWKNHFQTPSVFVEKSNFLFFDTDMKYSEDFNLWLRLMNHYKYALLIKEPLVYLGKEAFGVSGLSQNLYQMELGELRAMGHINNPLLRFIARTFSLIKYVRRVWITKSRMLYSTKPT